MACIKPESLNAIANQKEKWVTVARDSRFFFYLKSVNLVNVNCTNIALYISYHILYVLLLFTV